MIKKANSAAKRGAKVKKIKKSGVVRKQAHASSRTKRKQAKRDGRSSK